MTEDAERLISTVYTLPGDNRLYVGAWKHAASLASLKTSDLIERRGCAIELRRVGNRFEGSTRGKQCPSELRGAVYATAKVIVDSDALESWDQGFDSNDKQVWGATKGPYRFKRLKDGS